MLKGKRFYQEDYLHKQYDLNIIEKLDPITYQHSLNVALYAVQFVKSIGCRSYEPLVYNSGLFHDIGKTQIKAEVLNKPSALSKDEYCILKQHPFVGYNTLKNANFPKEILEAVLFHHERFDGQGYPMGLKEKEIPFVARIISICDVFDALTSDRPYRKAYTMDEALQIMKASAGQFDDDLLTDFISNIHEIVK